MNRPRLRTFSFPVISATLVGLFELLIYFASHGTPSQFSLGGVGFPLDEGSVFRTVVGVIFYALVVAHFWEMSQVYRLCEQHRADGVTTVSRYVRDCGVKGMLSLRGGVGAVYRLDALLWVHYH